MAGGAGDVAHCARRQSAPRPRHDMGVSKSIPYTKLAHQHVSIAVRCRGMRVGVDAFVRLWPVLQRNVTRRRGLTRVLLSYSGPLGSPHLPRHPLPCQCWRSTPAPRPSGFLPAGLTEPPPRPVHRSASISRGGGDLNGALVRAQLVSSSRARVVTRW